MDCLPTGVVSSHVEAIFRTPKVIVLYKVIWLLEAGPVCHGVLVCGGRGCAGPRAGPGDTCCPSPSVGMVEQLGLVGSPPALLGDWCSQPVRAGSPGLGRGLRAGAAPWRGCVLC